MEQFYDNEDMKKFTKWASVAVGILALFLLVKTLDAWSDWRAPRIATNVISVSGYGEAFATPDIATFSFSVTADAKAVADAQKTVTDKTDAVLSALENLGIEEKDIKTTDYNLYPKYTYVQTICLPNGNCPSSKQIPDGYTVTHTVTVKVRKTDDAGKALGVVGDNGGTNISGLNFTVDDPDATEAEARAKAVQNAKAKAKVLADNLGVDLGRIVSFSDGFTSPVPYPMYERATMAVGGMDMKAVAPSLSVGQNKTTDTVNITYEIR